MEVRRLARRNLDEPESRGRSVPFSFMRPVMREDVSTLRAMAHSSTTSIDENVTFPGIRPCCRRRRRRLSLHRVLLSAGLVSPLSVDRPHPRAAMMILSPIDLLSDHHRRRRPPRRV